MEATMPRYTFQFHTGSIKSEASFDANGNLVRLCFNSILVRLKGVAFAMWYRQLLKQFQFHTGSIKSAIATLGMCLLTT